MDKIRICYTIKNDIEKNLILKEFSAELLNIN